MPREQHGEWKAPRDRPDPVDLVIESSKGRIPELIPIRYGRMSVSPFTFYRGAALNMAADLAATPHTGIRVQACGDCHLMNFGGFATPERRRDLRHQRFRRDAAGPVGVGCQAARGELRARCAVERIRRRRPADAALACARSYRKRIAKYADMRALDVWYARIDMDAVLQPRPTSKARRGCADALPRPRRRASPKAISQSWSKAAAASSSSWTTRRSIYHDQSINLSSDRENILDTFAAYRETLPDDRRVLLDRYRIVDFAVKVVGVGSVGTFCGIVLLMAEDDDPLFLQVKEARASVLEPYLGKSAYPNGGSASSSGSA